MFVIDGKAGAPCYKTYLTKKSGAHSRGKPYKSKTPKRWSHLLSRSSRRIRERSVKARGPLGGQGMLPSRGFNEVQKDLDDIVSKIKGTNDPTLHHSLLMDMKLLLKEADWLAESKDLL